MSYRIGDNGLDHNIPNLDRQMGKMSLNNPPRKLSETIVRLRSASIPFGE